MLIGLRNEIDSELRLGQLIHSMLFGSHVEGASLTRMREAPAREKKAMLTMGVRCARATASSSWIALLPASPLSHTPKNAVRGTLLGACCL